MSTSLVDASTKKDDIMFFFFFVQNHKRDGSKFAANFNKFGDIR